MHTLLRITRQTFHPHTAPKFWAKMRKAMLQPPGPPFPRAPSGSLALGEGDHKAATSSLKQSKVPTSVTQISIYQYLQHQHFS